MRQRYCMVFLQFVLGLFAVFPAGVQLGRGVEAIQITRGETIVKLDHLGDAAVAQTLYYPDDFSFLDAKRRYADFQTSADPGWRLASLFGSRTLLQQIRIVADDDGRAVRASANQLAAASFRRGRWEAHFELPYRLVKLDDAKAVLSSTSVAPGNQVEARMAIVLLPPGATGVEYDRIGKILTYQLPDSDVVANAAAAAAEVAVEFTSRGRIMAAMPKIYSNADLLHGALWSGRTVIANRSGGAITDIRIRYRIAGVSPWSSDSRYDVLVSGGTLADWHYPVFPSTGLHQMAGEKVMEMALSYRDAAGVRQEDYRTAPIEVLPAGLFELTPITTAQDWLDAYINIPLLAGFVTASDEPIQRLAGQLRNTLNLPARQDEAGANLFLSGLYNQMRDNYVTCVDPPGFLTTSMDNILRIALPRDTLRTRNGTSVNLSIFFAAVAEAGGLESWLAFSPGVCLVGIDIPGRGRRLYDMATLSDGGGTVEYALASAEEKLAKFAPGLSLFIPVRHWQRLGTAVAETPPASGQTP